MFSWDVRSLSRILSLLTFSRSDSRISDALFWSDDGMVSVIRLCLSNGFEAIRDMSESCCAPSSCCRSLNPKEREGGGREGMRSRGDARKERGEE